MCPIGFIYGGRGVCERQGIAPGTRWEALPPNWTCPDCGARKEDFEVIEG
jgi:rubredoxin